MTHEGIKITVVTVTQEDDYSLRVFTLKVMHRHERAHKLIAAVLICENSQWLSSKRHVTTTILDVIST